MEVSDGGLFANDVEMSAETYDIFLPDNGGLIANDVEMSAENSKSHPHTIGLRLNRT